jgi:hypothetical protein
MGTFKKHIFWDAVLPVEGMSTKCPLFHSDLGAKGARNAGTEIVCNIQRGCEYRATQ